MHIFHKWGKWDWWLPATEGGPMRQARWCVKCEHIQVRDI